MALRMNVVAIKDGSGCETSVTTGRSYTVDAVLSTALAEIGYIEKETNSQLDDKTANAGDENWTKYLRDLDRVGFYGFGTSKAEWCDIFVDWCVMQVVCNANGWRIEDGMSQSTKDAIKQQVSYVQCSTTEMMTLGALCSGSLDHYVSANRAGDIPVRGAQIFFRSSSGGWGHTGIVYSYDSTTITTIEGNASNSVQMITYNRTSSKINGCKYGYPRLTGLYMPGETIPDDDATRNSFNGLKYSDSNPPLYCIQSQSRCYRNTKPMTIRGVLWHETAGGNPNIKRYVQPDDDAPDKQYWLDLLGVNKSHNDWNHKERSAGMNCWIGKLADGTVTTVQTMPWDYAPWGCGGGDLGSCNDGWIQFEICDDEYVDENYFNAVYEEACQITAYLCAKFNIDPLGTVEYKGIQVPTILDHRESHKLQLGCNHGDVRKWFSKYGKYDNGMETVRQDVAALMNSSGTYIPVVKVDDVVRVREGAISKDGQQALAWITSKQWKVSNTTSEDEYAMIGQRIDTTSVVLNKEYKKTDLTVVSATGTVDIPDNTGNLTNKERIWSILCQYVKKSDGDPNYFGVAGIMGNMMAESSLKPNNLQTTYENSLTGRSGDEADTYYTAVVDNGTYTNFVHDSAGYGLVQWTYYSLKEELLNYARSHNKSIGDLDMQVEFLCHQLSTGHKSVWDTCCNAQTVKEASDEMLHGFERPYKHDTINKETQENKREQYGLDIYEDMIGACSHSNTVLRDEWEATCSSDGYSGDEVCSDCGLTIHFGKVISATGHSYQNGVCTSCGLTPSEVATGATGGSSNTGGLVDRDDLIRILAVLKDMLSRES